MSVNNYLGGYEPDTSKAKSGGSYTPDNSSKAFDELKELLQQKTDEDIKFRRMFDDLMSNLDFDNMPAVGNYIDSLKKQTEKSLAAINIQADENSALIELITQWQGETNSSLALLNIKADANGGQIQLLTQWQGEAVTSMAEIRQMSNANGSSIDSIVKWQGETASSISNITQRVTAAEASIDSVVIWKGTAQSSIAAVQQKANDNESSIASLTQWKGTVDTSLGVMSNNYTQISQQTTQNSANISFITSSNLFTNNGNGTSSANASVILATFTDYNYATGKYQLKSNISMAADTIDLTGYVTFSSLLNAGQSIINGGNILTNTLSTNTLTSDLNGIVFNKSINFMGSDNDIRGVRRLTSGIIDGVNYLRFDNGARIESQQAVLPVLNISGAVDVYINGSPVLTAANYSSYIR